MNQHSETDKGKTRLDKWLWAARFFKTRSLCKEAIDGGKVQYLSSETKSQRVKANKNVSIGDTIEIRQGWDTKIIVVDALSEKRGSAQQANALYHETEESKQRREKEALMRKTATESVTYDSKKPDKRERRKQLQFTNKSDFN